MLRAIIFDFDGIIADTEPLHFRGFQKVLEGIGIPLTEREYYADYLGFDDRGAFLAALSSHNRPASAGTVAYLMQQKAIAYLDAVKERIVIFPGVPGFVRNVSTRLPLAIASGALRNEIELILTAAGLRGCFRHITSAEDVSRGKPDPQGFLLTLAALNRTHNGTAITPEDCLVIEDSLPGIRGARAAGMKVLAVANTHSIQELGEADAITHSLADVTLAEIEQQLWPSGTPSAAS